MTINIHKSERMASAEFELLPGLSFITGQLPLLPCTTEVS